MQGSHRNQEYIIISEFQIIASDLMPIATQLIVTIACLSDVTHQKYELDNFKNNKEQNYFYKTFKKCYNIDDFSIELFRTISFYIILLHHKIKVISKNCLHSTTLLALVASSDRPQYQPQKYLKLE